MQRTLAPNPAGQTGLEWDRERIPGRENGSSEGLSSQEEPGNGGKVEIRGTKGTKDKRGHPGQTREWLMESKRRRVWPRTPIWGKAGDAGQDDTKTALED